MACIYDVFDQQFANFFTSFFATKQQGTEIFGFVTTAEMASGKVWIRYDLQAVPAEAEPQTSVADVAPQAEPQVAAVVASPAEPQVLPEQAAEVAETNAMVAEKHDVDTVTPREQ